MIGENTTYKKYFLNKKSSQTNDYSIHKRI